MSKVCCPIAGLFCLVIMLGCESATATDVDIRKVDGQTMGTYYVVTVAEPPADFPNDWKLRVDAELRRVNDQMSTYLESSEITRFNRSASTDWFEVSPETAIVCQAAQQIAELTDGAFDCTVGPLVDLWNFGPGKRTDRPPTDQRIGEVQAVVGWRNLDVRLDPPALKKSVPELKIDLSANAKGHGVDRLITLLREMDCEHAFVDIGGENRAIGVRGDRNWRVAVEDPNDQRREYRLAFELNDIAIATSGDYRNFFEFEGERYSHTIDPRSGHPVTNQVASVSVFANDCMTADGWATAITVLGSEAGMKLAEQQGLGVRIVRRKPDDGFEVTTSSLFPKQILPNKGE